MNVVGYMLLMKIHEFDDDNCEVWIELNCGVLVKNECGDENLVIKLYEFMFWFTLMLFWCMITVGEVWVTFLGQWESKLRFWEKLVWVPERNPKFWVPVAV